jgi:hypothetical protein
MIHSGTNTPSSEIPTTGGMIHSGTNTPPAEVSTTDGMIHKGTNSPTSEVSTTGEDDTPPSVSSHQWSIPLLVEY